MDELLKQILAEIKSVRFEMNDRFNELKRTIEDHQTENIRADEMLLKTIMGFNNDVTEELITYEHQFKVINNELLRIKSDVDRLKSR